MAGIRVLTENESLQPANVGLLHILINVFQSSAFPGLYAYTFTISIHQKVALQRLPGSIFLGPTWSMPSFVGMVGEQHLGGVREDVRDGVNRFINAYLAANPRR